ncbi:MAG: LOG family protein, partial [Phaeodactylibacter sp.]|nr:LOG family protein [Phaeodactylibacter sp.]
LGQGRHPVGLLNINGFYGPLIAQLDTMAAEGFLKPAHRELLLVADDITTLLDRLESYQAPPKEGKWIKL